MKLSVTLMSILFELFLWIIFSLFNVIFWGLKFIVYSCYLAYLALSLYFFFFPFTSSPEPMLLRHNYNCKSDPWSMRSGLLVLTFDDLHLLLWQEGIDLRNERRKQSNRESARRSRIRRQVLIYVLLFDLSFLGNIFSILSIKVPVIFSHQILPCFEGWVLVSSLYTSNIYLQMWRQGILSMVS